MTDEKEFIWMTHQKGSIKYYSEAAYVKLQSEVERLKNACDFSGRVSTLEAKLQAAEAEIERQISLRKASESVDEEYRVKLEAAEADIAYWKGAWKSYSELYSVEKSGRLQAIDDARRLAEALGMVVAQFEDMQDSNDIQEHWHKIAREALTPEIRKKYLK